MSMQIMDVASQHLCKNAEIRKWQVSIRCRTQISLNMTLEIWSQVNAQLFIVGAVLKFSGKMYTCSKARFRIFVTIGRPVRFFFTREELHYSPPPRPCAGEVEMLKFKFRSQRLNSNVKIGKSRES